MVNRFPENPIKLLIKANIISASIQFSNSDGKHCEFFGFSRQNWLKFNKVEWIQVKFSIRINTSHVCDYPYQSCQPNVWLSSLIELVEVLFILEKPNFCPEVQAIFYAKYEKCVNSIYVCQEKIFVSRKYLSQENFIAKKISAKKDFTQTKPLS